MIHQRKFLYNFKFHSVADLIPVLLSIEADARYLGHQSPSVELQTDGTAGKVLVWEETLSDQSKQLVVMFA